MIIKKIYIGNLSEAFIEERFNERLNIIYSDDNNKGKTIVIQSIMYCLGNNPVFPASFKYEDYYYILTIESNGEFFDICRRKNNFIIKNKEKLFVFDNISEYKNYWDKNVKKLPVIIKDGRERLADLELLIQLFFVGQDKKMTHDIINSGWLKKADFINMVYALSGVENAFDIDEDIEVLKNKNKKLKEEKKLLLKKNKILKENNLAIETLSSTSNRIALEQKLKETDRIKKVLVSLSSARNNAIKRKTKNELVLKDLRSLNRTMKVGHISCMDCGSAHISYESADTEFSFDISTASMRTQIIKSIEDKMDTYKEEIERTTAEIKYQQKKLNSILETEEVSLEELLLAKIDLDGTQQDDIRLEEIYDEIKIVNNQIKLISLRNEYIDKESKEVLKDIILEMNLFDEHIDSSISNKYNDIFTKGDKIHSGSEGTQFHLSKMYAFSKVLKHNYPIIVDSFRAEDLSTEREKRILEKFKELQNQLIFTTTLKEEEDLKYESIDGINGIDYSTHQNYKILRETYVEELIKKLDYLMIKIN